MNRRGFLGFLAGGAAVAIGGEQLAELLLPKPTIFLPPAGGWAGGNRLLTVSQIVNEALKILEQNLSFTSVVNAQWNDRFTQYDGDCYWHGEKQFYSINIRKPPRLLAGSA